MKHKLFFLFLTLTVSTYAQKPSLRIFYGFSDAKLLENEDLDGAASDEIENLFEIGVEYVIPIFQKLNIVPGLTYTKTDLKNYRMVYYDDLLTSIIPSSYFEIEKLEILSIPVVLEFHFWDYFFVNGGPIISFQLNTPGEINYSQDGIGYHLGVGGRYNFKKFFVYANPFFKQFANIDFKDQNRDYNLSQFGVHVGLGYQL